MMGEKIYRSFLLVLLTVLVCETHGQISSTSNIYIEDGLEVHAEGDVARAGFIQNQGNLFVTRNWRNTSV